MRIGVFGIAYERCLRMVADKHPSGKRVCILKENRFCKISTCAFNKGVKICFECPDFPCETNKQGPIDFGYCMFISGKAS